MTPSESQNQNVASLLARSAARRASVPAVIDAGRSVSYFELGERAGGVAEALRTEGVCPGDRVAVLLERSADTAAIVAGIHAAGGVAVVVNPRLRVRQVEYVIADASPTLVFSSDDVQSALGRPIDSAAPIRDAANIDARAALDPIERGPTDLAEIIYTSGSTGMSKGVAFSHQAILTGVSVVSSYLGLTADDRIASLLPFSAVYGLNQLLCSIAVGGTLVIETSTFAADIVAALRRHEATVAAGVPPLWSYLLSIPDFGTPIPSLRILQNAGGHLPVDVVRRLRAAQPGAELFLQYGMTETWRSTYLPPSEVDRRPGSMGRAVPGTEILLLRDDGSSCDADEIGQLVHAGPTIAAEYWRKPAESAETFREHPLRPGERAVYSGDMARRDADGFFYYVGRRDRIIKTLGYRVGPDEIADVLHASGQIREVAVTAEDDADRGQRIIAWVVLTDEGTVAKLSRFSRAELPPYMQPSRFEVRSALPRLASGKYDLAALTSSDGNDS